MVLRVVRIGILVGALIFTIENLIAAVIVYAAVRPKLTTLAEPPFKRVSVRRRGGAANRDLMANI